MVAIVMSPEESRAYDKRLEELVIMEFDDIPHSEPPPDRPKRQERCNWEDYYELDTKFLKRELNKGVVCVEFVKKDGTKRTMLCTRNLDLVPSDQHPNNKSAHYKNFSPKGVVRAFEVVFVGGNRSQLAAVGFEGWRSFHLSSIKKLRFDHPSVSDYVRHAADQTSRQIEINKGPVAYCF